MVGGSLHLGASPMQISKRFAKAQFAYQTEFLHVLIPRNDCRRRVLDPLTLIPLLIKRSSFVNVCQLN